MVEPKLFHFGWVTSRDHKIYAILCVFLGGFFGRAIIDAVGSAGALGVVTGIKILIALSWWFIPDKNAKSS